MSDVTFAEFEKRLDDLALPLLLPLRTSKSLNQAAMNDVRQLLVDLGAAIAGEQMVPKSLVGKLYFLFTSMLAEAAHAKSTAPILDAAWEIEELLRRIFGPRFD